MSCNWNFPLLPLYSCRLTWKEPPTTFTSTSSNRIPTTTTNIYPTPTYPIQSHFSPHHFLPSHWSKPSTSPFSRILHQSSKIDNYQINPSPILITSLFSLLALNPKSNLFCLQDQWHVNRCCCFYYSSPSKRRRLRLFFLRQISIPSTPKPSL